MNKTLIAAAALASLAGAAQAQSVTLYGRVDVGFEYVSKTANGAGGTDSVSKLENGGILPSIWGLRGSEDLGNGLKAVFNLESDFDGSTGGERFGGSLRLFGRQANVGLSGGFGTVLLGRQYSPAILADLGTEPRGFKESFSLLLPYALSQAPAGNGTTGNNFLGIFNGNMVSYTGAFGPVTLRAGYGLGEQASGKSSAGSTVALGATYTGPITVSASYQQIKGLPTAAVAVPPTPAAVNADAETRRYSLGVAVPLGDLTLKAYYSNAKRDNGTGVEDQDLSNIGLGVNYAWAPANTLTVAYYHGKDKKFAGGNGKTNDIVISNDYALSKRTTFYAQYVHADVDANANAAGSIAADRGLVAGEKTSILSVGLKHDF